jgi:hypothetical protein
MMRYKPWIASLALLALGTAPANAQIIKGVMGVKGAEMS